MKKDIHPKYYHDAKIVCSCGNVITDVGSTVEIIKTELCSACHPFYTGKQKYVDTQGRIEIFQKRRQAVEIKKEEKKAAQEAASHSKIAATKPSSTNKTATKVAAKKSAKAASAKPKKKTAKKAASA